MIVEEHFKFGSPFGADLFDAVGLVVIIIPLLYFLVYKPLEWHVTKRDQLLAQVSVEQKLAVEKADLIGLINDVTLVANEAETVEACLRTVLSSICKQFAWSVGHAYRPVYGSSGEVSLASTGIWFLSDSERFEAVRKCGSEASFLPGEGWPGKVYVSQSPMCIADSTAAEPAAGSEKFKEEGGRAGLKGVYIFPVLTGKKTSAVLEFFSERAEETNQLHTEVLSNLALQIGRVMERKEAEASLKKLGNAMEQTTDGIMTTRSDGTIEYVNPAFERSSGYKKDEVVGKNPRLLASGKHTKEFFGQMWDTIKSGGVWTGVITNKRKSGEIYDEEITISPVHDANDAITHFIAVRRDVTEKKMLRTQLIQAEKMFTVGAFVSGVAHELNNPLTAILGFSQRLLSKGTDFPPDVSHQLGIIGEQTKRAVKIVQNLLQFSRKAPPTTIFCNVNEVLDSTLSFLEYGFRSDNIKVRKDYEPTVRVKGDVGQLQQVFTNIMLNAQHEMKKTGGVISITTKKNDGEARIIIENTGPPIPPDIMERLFDPFYTTKSPGEGTGLGLYIAFGIVADHNGKIWAESNHKASGARFIITLPLEASEKRAVPPERPKELEAPKADLNNKKVLVAEDEEFIKKWLCELLEESGALVQCANDGEEALELLVNNVYDFVISDIKMPRKSGYDIGKWIFEKRPAMKDKFLIITGVIDNDAANFCKEYSYPLLQKPFGANELLTALSNMGDNHDRRSKYGKN